MIETSRKPPSAQILIGLLLTLGLANLPIGQWGQHLLGNGNMVGMEGPWWIALLICLSYVLLVEKRPLSSIGFRRLGMANVGLAFAAWALTIIGIGLIVALVLPALHLRMNTDLMNRLRSMPFWFRVELVTRAAIVEEILFRGYAIERIQELTGSRLFAGAISLAAFTIAHLRLWGWAQLIIAGFAGLILTVLYIWRRNIWANMIAHWLIDGAGFLIGH